MPDGRLISMILHPKSVQVASRKHTLSEVPDSSFIERVLDGSDGGELVTGYDDDEKKSS